MQVSQLWGVKGVIGVNLRKLSQIINDGDKMNVKFKMPNFRRNLKGKAIAKELLMTVIGTTISIVLTFGTAHLVERHQKRAAGRQTAMMAIHDIDNAVTTMRTLARQEDENFQIAAYVLNRQDSIGHIGIDTLESVMQYITHLDFTYSDASEHTFLSSQDAWKNINNAQFIDIMESFYHSRRETYAVLNKHYLWRRPLTEDDEYRLMLEADDYQVDLASALATVLRDKHAKAYIEFAPARQRAFNSMADSWQKLSNQAKFTLGITDEELTRFLEQKERHGSPLTKSTLMGRWVNLQSDDNEVALLFMKDNRLRYTLTTYVANPFYTGRIVYDKRYKGTWRLDGDSLFLSLDNNFDCSIDDSQATCQEQMRDSLKSFVKHAREQFELAKEQAAAAGGTIELRYAASIDESGSKIELRRDETDEGGKVITEKDYLARKDE